MTARRRMIVVLVAMLVAGGAVIALLVSASRPPTAQPFHFPGAHAATPTVEISAGERARLEQILNGIRETPGNGTPVRR
jgi:hypothetical protein